MRLATQIGLAIALAVGLGDAVQAAPTGGVVVVEHRDPALAPTKGPTGALVTVEVFFAPTVNQGARLPAYRTLERLAAKHPTRVRIVYRVLLRGGAGPLLPVAALEAHAQGLFFEFMEKLHVIRTNLSRDQVLDIGKQIGMDVSRLDAVLPAKPGVEFKGSRYSDIIDDNEHRFDRLHGNNAPNVLFNSRPPRSGSVGSLGDNDMEREYNDAYERALEMLDRGVDRRALQQAFDDAALRGAQPLVINPTGDDINGDPTDHPLAKPPIDLKGLPSYGKPGPHAAPVPVVVLCRPNDSACNNVLRTLGALQLMYNDDVRIVWAPFFDVTRDDAAELTMLGDAVLCAEQVGSSPEDMAASPGWRWITKQLTHVSNAHGRRVPAEKLIDAVSTEIDVDPARMAACRARMANTTLEIVDKARKSGVAHGPIALIIGGRIYESLTDKPVIQQLIEAEIAPGVLGEVAPAWRPLRK